MQKNTLLKTFVTAAVSSAAFLCVGVNNAYAASFNSISRIYAFGDSYSDNGAALQITTAAVKAGVPGAFIFPRVDVYDSGGRWTNNPGLTSVEVLAKQENLQLTDYAVGGAKSGNGNLSTWLDQYQDTGLFGQIEEYKTEVNRVADSNGLYFIFISSNDLLERFFYNQTGSIDVLADAAVKNIASGISQLASLGAKQFFVVNSTDLAALPLTGGLEPGCSTPDNYYYFDEIHPTRRVYQIIGEDMANFLEAQKTTIPEPSTVVALISCMGMISLLRRKVRT